MAETKLEAADEVRAAQEALASMEKQALETTQLAEQHQRKCNKQVKKALKGRTRAEEKLAEAVKHAYAAEEAAADSSHVEKLEQCLRKAQQEAQRGMAIAQMELDSALSELDAAREAQQIAEAGALAAKGDLVVLEQAAREAKQEAAMYGVQMSEAEEKARKAVMSNMELSNHFALQLARQNVEAKRQEALIRLTGAVRVLLPSTGALRITCFHRWATHASHAMRQGQKAMLQDAMRQKEEATRQAEKRVTLEQKKGEKRAQKAAKAARAPFDQLNREMTWLLGQQAEAFAVEVNSLHEGARRDSLRRSLVLSDRRICVMHLAAVFYSWRVRMLQESGEHQGCVRLMKGTTPRPQPQP